MSQPRQHTEQQRRAVELRGVSVVLSSGAGCGKTSALTERYLSHLRHDGADVGQVVAITFTDRAAREMRARIRQAITGQLQSATGDEALRWRKHRRDLEAAPICTIHSFCGNLLRQHAVLAGLDPRFEVLQEVLAATIRQEAVTAELQALLTSAGDSRVDLHDLVVLYGWPATVQAVEELIGEYDPPAWERWLARTPEAIAADWLGSQRDALRRQWVDYLVTAYPPIAHCLALLRSVPCIGPETRGNVARILNTTPQLATTPDLAGLIAELVEAAKVGKERAKAWADETTYRDVQHAFREYRDKLPEKLALFLEEPADLVGAVETGQRFLRVARQVAQAYQNRKRRIGAVDFQDLLVLARDLVRDHAEVRAVLEQRYRYVLLDELQDTDPVQMELVELLCGSIGLRHGKLFAVGDDKQSIYRFRGADVRLFDALRATVAEPGRLSLSCNFRSQPPILDFVNALCSQRFPRYEPLEAHHPRLHDEPCIEFLWNMPGDGEGKRNAPLVRRREAEAIGRRIVELLQDPTPRVYEAGHLRPVRPGDIVLLFRSMSNVGLYESALRRLGLDYYLVGGRAFFAQQEVYDLLNLLRCLENPEDAVSLAGTLRSPFCCLSDESLTILALHRDGLWAGLHDEERLAMVCADQKPAVLRARRVLGRWQEHKDRLPIARLIGEVLADSGYDAALQFEFLGDRKLANLWKLVDMARTFDRSVVFGLPDFIRQLGHQVERQPREEQAATQPENADVIRLMSIHQAKGLEFPVVIVPDLAAVARGEQFAVARWHRDYGCLVRPPAEDEPPPFSKFGWRLGETADTLAEWAEDLRILYVACTRARDLLILSAGFPQPLRAETPTDRPVPLPGANTWTATLGERFHLLSGRCLAADVPSPARPDVRVRTTHGSPDLGPAAGPPPDSDPDPDMVVESPPRRGERPALTERSVVSLYAVEWLERLSDDGTSGLFAEEAPLAKGVDALADAFITEDGSDRHRWYSLRERLRGAVEAPEVERDAVVRFVLGRWPLHDADGWQELLVEAVAELEPRLEPSRLTDEIAPLLRTFAGSEIREQLVAAPVCCRDVEFLVDGPAALKAADVVDASPAMSLPILRGVLDFLWQDRNGAWHLLAVEPGEDRFRRDAWYGRKPFLTIQAWAVREQLGRAPLSVTLFDLAENRVEHMDGRRLRYAQAFARVREALTRALRAT